MTDIRVSRRATDRLCCLVVRVSGYRYRGPGFDPRRYLNEKSSGSRSRKQRLTAVGTRCADHVTPLYPLKLALTSPTGGGRSIGIVRVRTKATEFYQPVTLGGRTMNWKRVESACS